MKCESQTSVWVADINVKCPKCGKEFEYSNEEFVEALHDGIENYAYPVECPDCHCIITLHLEGWCDTEITYGYKVAAVLSCSPKFVDTDALLNTVAKGSMSNTSWEQLKSVCSELKEVRVALQNNSKAANRVAHASTLEMAEYSDSVNAYREAQCILLDMGDKYIQSLRNSDEHK